jgi:hypothetical protein
MNHSIKFPGFSLSQAARFTRPALLCGFVALAFLVLIPALHAQTACASPASIQDSQNHPGTSAATKTHKFNDKKWMYHKREYQTHTFFMPSRVEQNQEQVIPLSVGPIPPGLWDFTVIALQQVSEEIPKKMESIGDFLQSMKDTIIYLFQTR